ncbi:MAG: glycosyltransferase family 4 protein, partial [Anaerolineae bacterium]
MRIGLLAYGLDRPLSGISRYTVELTRTLAALPGGHEVHLLAAGGVGSLAQETGSRVASLPSCSRLPGLVTLGNVLIPRGARRLQVNIVHDPTGVTPFLFGADGAKTVVTIHDVFAWSCPGHSTWSDMLIYRYWLPRVLPRVDAVIAVSQTSRTDIVNHLRIPHSQVHVIYEGVDTHYHPISSEEAAQTASRYGLPKRYILFVGSVEERKNLRRLLQACARLWQGSEVCPLVVVGPHKWKYRRILQTVEELGISKRVIFTGYVPDEALPALYSGADLFVFPSLYEGFGLPPLEAMACGTPVVCSKASSLPEVVGDAALMVDPYDVEALAEAMHRVLSDAVLREEQRGK